MNVAGRKMVGSTATPLSAGFICSRACFDASRDRERVRAELLLDDQHQAGTAVDNGVADRRRKPLDNGGDVADAQHRAVARRDDDRFEILDGARPPRRA